MTFALSVFAIFFISQFIAVEHAPLDAMLRLRGWLTSYHPAWAKLFKCSYCLSVWIAIPFAVQVGWGNLFLDWCALIGATWALLGLAGRENND